jgi:multiple sugar transport system permease protein
MMEIKMKLRRELKENIEGYLFISPALLGVLIFSLGPMVASLILSFMQYDIVTPPRLIGFSNFRNLFIDPLFSKALFNTLYYVGGVVPLRLIVALLAAILLNQKVRGVTFFRTAYYIPSVSAGVAISIVWTYVFDPQYGLMNSVLGYLGIPGPPWIQSTTWAMPALILMGTWSIGQPMVIFLAGLQGIPTHLYEAVSIDGGNWWHKFRYVTLPMLTPVIFFNMVMQIIGTFQIFTSVYIMTNGGPMNSTLVYVFYLYQQAFQWLRMGYGSALAWILFLIIFILTLMQFRISSLWVYHE